METYREKRPWGEFHQYTKHEVSTVKTLIVNPGESLSDQRHQFRTELWISHTVGGRVHLEYADGQKEVVELIVGTEVEIPVGTWHRLECLPDAPAPIRLTEVSFGKFDENDNERRSDKYGRSSPTPRSANL